MIFNFYEPMQNYLPVFNSITVWIWVCVCSHMENIDLPWDNLTKLTSVHLWPNFRHYKEKWKLFCECVSACKQIQLYEWWFAISLKISRFEIRGNFQINQRRQLEIRFNWSSEWQSVILTLFCSAIECTKMKLKIYLSEACMCSELCQTRKG